MSLLLKFWVYKGSSQQGSGHGLRYGSNLREWRGNGWMWSWGAGRLVTSPPDPELVECEKMNSLPWRALWGSRDLEQKEPGVSHCRR